MDFALWDGLQTSLESGPFHLRQPSRVSPSIVLRSNDWILMPCVSLSDSGMRIGYGAGYYDRYLGQIECGNFLKVGITWEADTVRAVAADQWDIPVQIICTEAGWRPVKNAP